MTTLAELQHALQNGILGTPGRAEALIAAPPSGSRAQRFDVYRNGYLLRLTEFLANDYDQLKCYLGETRFNDMARAYAIRHPSDNPNARWFSKHLPDFLKDASPFRRHPELAEIARLEQALNDVFDAPDTPILVMQDLAAIPPEDIGTVSFELVPAVQKIIVTTNVSSLWSSLKCGETPPSAIDLDTPVQILVWRQQSGSRFRLLGDEEAMALDCVAQGLSFAAVCEMIAMHDAPDDAAMRAAGYLRGWLEAEIIAGIRLAEAGSK